MITVHHYATHLPALVGCVSHTDGRVLELGAGVYSTPILHAACAGRELVTADYSAEWMERFLYLRGPEHRFELVRDWGDYGRLDEDWSVALVDQTPGRARVMSVERLRSHCRFIVVHDTNDSERFGYEPLLSSFRYRQDYTELGAASRTTVVSDSDPLPFALPNPTDGHGVVPLADSPIVIETTGPRWDVRTLESPWPAKRHFFVAGTVDFDAKAGVDVQILFCNAAQRPVWWIGLNGWQERSGDGSFCIPRDAAGHVPLSAGGVEHPSWDAVDRVVLRARSSSPAKVRISELRLLAWSEADQELAPTGA